MADISDDNYRCPICNNINLVSCDNWLDVKSMPTTCKSCGELYWGPVIESETYRVGTVSSEAEVPELVEGTPVVVINAEHSRHMAMASIIAIGHKHYRLHFKDGAKMWMPDPWVVRVP